MKTGSSAEPAKGNTIPGTGSGSNAWIWACALASILAIVVVYYFAFSAAHEVRIQDVPLAPKGAKP